MKGSLGGSYLWIEVVGDGGAAVVRGLERAGKIVVVGVAVGTGGLERVRGVVVVRIVVGKGGL